ncbi:MAG: putative zinc-binding metallopeptidase [Ginsengibacter sp.]
MNKKLIFILLSGLLVFLISCSKKDDFNGTIKVFDAPDLEGNSPVQLKVKNMYETYNVLFKPSFKLEEYTWNWNSSIKQTAANVVGLRYTPAKENYVVPVIDSIENWVFKVFPPEFSKKYMPLNILLTDTLENKFNFIQIIHRIYEGNIAANYILVSYVSERFDLVKEKRLLPESWLSLFVEKMLITRLPAPVEFSKVSTAGYAKLTFTNAEDVMKNFALLKKGRTKQNSGLPTAAWTRVSIEQDFGDYVAFIVYTPETEKQLAYAKNPDILKKVNLVKSYFRENFQIELPYLPKSN